jgi:hypothetical protein
MAPRQVILPKVLGHQKRLLQQLVRLEVVPKPLHPRVAKPAPVFLDGVHCHPHGTSQSHGQLAKAAMLHLQKTFLLQGTTI